MEVDVKCMFLYVVVRCLINKSIIFKFYWKWMQTKQIMATWNVITPHTSNVIYTQTPKKVIIRNIELICQLQTSIYT